MTSETIRPRRSYQAWVANETMEDYSLRYAAKSFRRWSPFVIANTALGGISFLALEAIGGAITLSYGFNNAIPAILVVCVLVFITNLPIAYYSSKYNVDMDLLTRGAGFGYIGSTITSLIYAGFTFIFFALEAAIMAQALEIYFGLPIVVGYIVSSIVIIPITFLGVTLISRLQIITQPIWLIMLVAPFIFILYREPSVLTDWVEFAGNRDDAAGFNYLHFGAATGILFALVVQIGEQVDYLRFLPDKTAANRVRWWAAVISAGPGWIVIGGLKILAGSLLAVIAVGAGLAYSNAVEPIHMYIKAYEYVSDDPWLVLTLATFFVLVSQIKINVTNAYAGSLAWSNFYSRVTHYHPGRVVWLVFNILISLLLMLMGVFETLETVLAIYSILAIAWIGAIFADLTVLKPRGISPPFIEFKRAHLYNINPVGCGAMAIASVIALTAHAGLLGEIAEAYSAALSLGISFVVAVLIGYLTRGRYYIARPDSLAGTAATGRDTMECVICSFDYEVEDMAHCPFNEGPICSLCCSLDAHCHDVCKWPENAPAELAEELKTGRLQRLIPPNIARRLARFLGVFLVLALVTAAVMLLAYRMIELDPDPDQVNNARILVRLYLASLALICIGAWWIVLSHDSRELAERELVDSLEELKETRQELMQSERLATIGQLTATVSHELRNPLGTMLSSVSVLHKYLADAEAPVRDELNRVQRNIWRSAHIIEDLLEFSRKREILTRAVPIDQWTAAQLDELILPSYVTLKTELHSGAMVLIDSEKFRQVLVNLVQNAHQAITLRDDSNRPEGRLLISTQLHDGRVELRIEDDGGGVLPEHVDKIFKPLFSAKAFGVGLGLPLVQRIVERHEGDINIESEPGKGTVVTIGLPVARREAGGGLPAESLRPSVGGERQESAWAPGGMPDKAPAAPGGVTRHVMVVDDDKDFADSLSHLLTLEGYQVARAYSLSGALTAMDQNTVEVALIDIRMGERSGLSLIADLQRRHPEVVCVMMTAHASARTAIKALQGGAYDYLCKPFFSEDLTATLERSFERIALTHSREQAESALRHRNLELEDVNARLHKVVAGLQGLSTCSTLRELCLMTLEEISRNLGGCKAAIWLNDGDLVFAQEGFEREVDEASEQAWFRQLLEEQSPVSLSDEPAAAVGPGQAIGFPLTGEGSDAVGVLAIRASGALDFTRQDHEFAGILASFASEAIRLIQTLENLALSEERLRKIIDNSPSLISLKDLEGRILIVNRCFEEWHGYRQEDVGGRRYNDVFPEAIARLYELQFEEVIASGKTAVGEIEIPFPDGTLHSVLMVKFPVFGTDGQPMAVGTIGTDITDRKRTEEHLRQAQKMEVLGQLTRGIAHDFNNILAVVSGNLDLAKDELGDAPETRELVEDALSASRSGAELTHRWLAFGRSQVLRPQATDANSLVAGMIRMLERTLGEAIGIEQDLAAGLWPIEIDRNQLETSLLNLAINARDAMPGGGVLTIRTANVSLGEGTMGAGTVVPGDYVLLSVRDGGTGMTPEVAAQAVQPFFTTKVVGQGSGLGLSMVYGFVHQSGGYLDVTSQPGAGTTVRLHLPRSEAVVSDGAAGPDRIMELGGDGERILVVEDRPDVRKIARTILTRLGYDVLEAVDSQDAMTLLAEVRQVDLLFTDLVLPGGMNGIQLARTAQARYPALKVLCTSGYPDDAALGHALHDEEFAFVRKPFVSEELASMVRQILDTGRPSDG